MQPRLKSSKKWTAFPQEYSDQIETVFKENFAKYLGAGKLVIEGRIYSEEILLRVGISKKGQLSQPNFEVSMNYSQSKKDAIARIHNCIDAAASMMMDYFENEEVTEDLPLVWQEFPFQGQKVFLQYTTENTELEAMANALLGDEAYDDTLVHDEEDTDEDLIEAAADAEAADENEDPAKDADSEVDPSDSDDSDTKSPKMFGSPKKKKSKKSSLH